MIQSRFNGTALSGISDIDGSQIIRYTDQGDYGTMYSTFSRQAEARRENQGKLDTYLVELQSAQLNEDAGRPHPAPPQKPTFTFISDGHEDYWTNSVTPGQESQIPWPSPLPDFRPLRPVGSK